MKHRSFRMALIVALVTGLAACGGGGTDDVAEPPAGGAPVRLEVQPAGGMLTDLSERRTLRIVAFDANDVQVPAPAGATLTASGTGFSLTPGSGSGELQAVVLGGSVVVAAQAPGLATRLAIFYSAELADGVKPIDDAQVVSAPVAALPGAPEGSAFRTLVTVRDAEILRPGDIVASRGMQTIAGRVLSSAPSAADARNRDVVYEKVPVGSVFKTAKLDLRFTSQESASFFVPEGTSKQAQALGAGGKRLAPKGGAGPCVADTTTSLINVELEGTVDPSLDVAMAIDVRDHQTQTLQVNVSGTMLVKGKAVLTGGVTLVGQAKCVLRLGAIRIPVTGPLAAFIAPSVPLKLVGSLRAEASLNAVEFAAEVRNSTTLNLGVDYDRARAPADQLQTSNLLEVGAVELDRTVTFPTDASPRLKTTVFLGLGSGLDIGSLIGDFEIIEAEAGGEFEAKFGGAYDAAIDTVYTTGYELKAKAGVAPGPTLQEWMEDLLGKAFAVNLSAKYETVLASASVPTEVSVPRDSFAAGEEMTFTVKLDPTKTVFPGVGYNVSEVRIYRLDHDKGLLSADNAVQVASAVPVSEQTVFTLKWTPPAATTVTAPDGRPNFFAYVVDKPLADVSRILPFELGPVLPEKSAPLFRMAITGTAIYAIEDGRIFGVGTNNGGALGPAIPIGQSVTLPVAIPLNNVVSVTGSAWHAHALLRDGTVWGWGWGQNLAPPYRGQNNPTPARVGFVADVVSISSGYYDTAALASSGEVWIWGKTPPTMVWNRSNLAVTAVSQGGAHTLMLAADGTVWARGANDAGQLGDGTRAHSTVPVQVTGLADVVEIAAGGSHSAARTRSGEVWTWGLGNEGALGVGSRASSNVPLKVALAGVTKISSAEHHTLALADGVLYSWGWLTLPGCSYASPTVVMTGVADMDAGEFGTMALSKGGEVHGWGLLAGVLNGCTARLLRLNVR